MADISLLSGFVACIEQDDDHSTAADKVQAIARPIVNSHLGDFTFDRLPIAEIASFCLPQACGDSNLGPLVLQGIKPSDELFGLANCEHAAIVAIWIQVVKGPAVLCGLTLELSGPLRQRTGPARPMIDNDGLAGPVRCRSGSALERRVRPRPNCCKRRGLVFGLADCCGRTSAQTTLGTLVFKPPRPEA